MAAAHKESHEKEPEIIEEAPAIAPEASGEEAVEPRCVTISEVELEALNKELGECKDKYLRVLAETENARKRMQREKHELVQYAVQNVIVEFLSPIDHMENALKYAEQMSDEVKHWAVGFQMILNQFKDVLSANGIEPFASEGQIFDPHWHEAIETIETDTAAPGVIVKESLRGYKMADRVIRPARVTVAKELPSEASS